jgi:uncharacterized protein with gpF-like domain
MILETARVGLTTQSGTRKAKNIVLSKKKAEWADRFKPALLKGSVLSPSAKAEKRFSDDLAALTEKMTRDVSRHMLALLASPAGKEVMDAVEPVRRTTGSLASQGRVLMNFLSRKWRRIFLHKANPLAERMVAEMAKSSTRALRDSLRKATGAGIPVERLQGGQIGEILAASVNEAAGLIKRIPEEFTGRIQDALQRSIATRAGTDSLYRHFEEEAAKHGIKTKNWAYNTARDQTHKAFANLTRERMKNAGITRFEWLHSGAGSQPRPHHQKRWPEGLNRGIFDLNDPPIIDPGTGERGLPSQLPNCRCKYIPVIEP